MPNQLPYTMEMYRKDLKKIMTLGQSPVSQPSLIDKLRQAAMNMSSTTLAGSTL